jgi:hypothetical protein
MTRTRKESAVAQARQDSVMRTLYEGLGEENALQVAWVALSHKHARYTGELDSDLIDEVFARDFLAMIQEYTCDFMTYVDVLSVHENRVTISARLTTELPLKVNGLFLKLPSCPLINEAAVLDLRVSGATIAHGSIVVTDHEKEEDSLAAKISFDIVPAERHHVEVHFLAANCWLAYQLVRVDPPTLHSHPSG